MAEINFKLKRQGIIKLPKGEYVKQVKPVKDGLLIYSLKEIERGVRVSKTKPYYVIPYTNENLHFIRIEYPDFYEDCLDALAEREEVLKRYKKSKETYHPKLFPYQRKGVSFILESLKANQGVLLADDMGLGKTVQALAVVKELNPENLLIVTPNSVKENWKTEAKTWFDFEFEVDRIGEKKLVVNYEKLIAESFSEYILSQDWDLIILDEAHRLKNIFAKRTRVVRQISTLSKAKFILLTGTPIFNRPDDLFSLLHLCSPNRFPKKKWFIEKYLLYYQMPIRKKVGNTIQKINIIKVVGIKNRKGLNEDTKDIMLRRTKEEVLKELPKKIIEYRYVSLRDAQTMLYNEAEEEFKLTLNEKELKLSNALVKLNRLRQIAVSPYLIEPSDEYLFSPKVDALIEIFNETEQKLLCYTKYKLAVDLASKILKKQGIPAYIITGESKPSERLSIIKAFEKEKEPGILVGTIDSLAEGLNLQFASNIAVFLDLDFSYSKNEQLEDRIVRIGQLKKPIIIRIMARCGVDYFTLHLIKEKKSVSDYLFSFRWKET